MTATAHPSQFLRSHRRGASLVETGLLVGLVAVVAIGAITVLGARIDAPFCRAAALLSGTTMDCASVAVVPDGAGSGGNGSGGNAGGGTETPPTSDGLPDVSGLHARIGWPGATETYGGIVVSDIEDALPIILVDPAPGTILTVGDSVSGQGPFTVRDGDALAFTVTVPASGTAGTIAFRIGDTDFSFTVRGGDIVADAFAVPPVTNARGEAWVLSQPVTPTGFDLALPIGVTGRDALLFIGSSGIGLTSGTLAPGQGFQVGMTSGPETGEPVSVDVNLGQSPDTVSASWSVTAQDLTPDAIVFADTAGHVPGEWAYSGSVEVTGLAAGIPVSMSGGSQVSVDGGPWASAATVNPYSQVRFRQRIPSEAAANDAFTTSGLFGAVGGRPASPPPGPPSPAAATGCRMRSRFPRS